MENIFLNAVKEAEQGNDEELEELYEDSRNWEYLDWLQRGEESIAERNGF